MLAPTKEELQDHLAKLEESHGLLIRNYAIIVDQKNDLIQENRRLRKKLLVGRRPSSASQHGASQPACGKARSVMIAFLICVWMSGCWLAGVVYSVVHDGRGQASTEGTQVSTVRVYEWNGHTWSGWWQGDKEIPVEFEDVVVQQRDRGQLYVGMPMSFDVPNGDDWSTWETGLDRWTMEACEVAFYVTNGFQLEGFVQVEKFGKAQKQPSGTTRPWPSTASSDRDVLMAYHRLNRWRVRGADGFLYPNTSTPIRRFFAWFRDCCPECKCIQVISDGVSNRYGDPQVHCAACNHVWCSDTDGL